jgi:hypothetical protein
MDIISHGLYGGVVFGQKDKKQFWLSTAFGVMPDFLAFGLPFAGTIVAMIAGSDVSIFSQAGHHTDAKYIYIIYNITHSLIIRGIVFGILWLIYKKPVKASFARLLHILIDIPTHSLAFFATPFLRPISSYKFDGIPWSNKMIFIPNLVILVVLYSIYFYKKAHKHKK